MRKPQPIERRPTFSNMSERYMKNCMNLNLMRIEDKTRDEKAMEKKNNVEEICASSLDCMLIKRDNAVREKPAKVKIILSLCK